MRISATALFSRVVFAAAVVTMLTGALATNRFAELSGSVVDGNGLPIREADVTLVGLAKSTLTNDSGQFRFGDIPRGSHELRVRKLGYLEYSDIVTVLDQGTPLRRVVLRKVPTLNPVDVTAGSLNADFDENRKLGLGKFMTRSELQKVEHRMLGEIVGQVGARVVRIGPHAWVGSSRTGTRSLKTSGQKCSDLDGAQVRIQDRDTPNNPGCGCYAAIYLDDAVLFSGESGGRIPDLNLIMPASLEAIEFYKSAAQTPLKYSRLNSQCGVLVLHTRRSIDPPKKP